MISWHITEEECHDKRVDVRTIDIGIGHDDNLMITQLVDIGSLTVVLRTNGHTQCGIDITNLFAFECLVIHGFLHIQNLTTKWKDGLEVTVTTLLGSTACGVTLDEEELAFRRVLIRAVGQFARQSATRQRRLTVDEFTVPTSGMACCGSQILPCRQ
jgi:hypothetical protein